MMWWARWVLGDRDDVKLQEDAQNSGVCADHSAPLSRRLMGLNARALLLVVAALTVLNGCDDAGTPMQWSYAFSSSDLAARATHIDIAVRKERCYDGDEVYASTLDVASPEADAPPALDPGTYALEGSARDGRCLHFARGCTLVDVPAAAGTPVVVALDAVAEALACASGCTSGACGVQSTAGSGPTVEAPDTGGLWWDDAWQRRLAIEIDREGQQETLSDFPVRVVLSPSNFDYAEAAPGGADLRFTDDSHADLLAYDIETWAPGAESTIWVKARSVPAGVKSYVWLYSANASAPPGADSAGVWTNGYQAVYHLQTLPNADSSGRSIAATQVGSGGRTVPGVAAGAQDLGGARDAIALGKDQPWLMGLSRFTLSLWAQIKSRPSGGSQNGVMLALSIGGDDARQAFSSRGQLLLLPSGEIEGTVRSADNEDARKVTSNTKFDASNSFHHFALVADVAQGTLRLLINGGELETREVSLDFAANAVANTPSMAAALGADDRMGLPASDPAFPDFDDHPFDGILDEVRISSVARSPAWLQAHYLNLAGSLVRYAALETR